MADSMPAPRPRPSPEASSRTGCAMCEQLQQEVNELRQARDEALLAFARERAQTEGLILNLQRGPLPPRLAEARPHEEPAPLRHKVVDGLNHRFKRIVGPLHGLVKSTIQGVMRVDGKS